MKEKLINKDTRGGIFSLQESLCGSCLFCVFFLHSEIIMGLSRYWDGWIEIAACINIPVVKMLHE